MTVGRRRKVDIGELPTDFAELEEELRQVEGRLGEVRNETRILEARKAALLARRSEAVKRDMADRRIHILQLDPDAYAAADEAGRAAMIEAATNRRVTAVAMGPENSAAGAAPSA
jgi:hypothetical protein